jgi:sugar phosphate isomerase/epimerase
VKVMTYTRHLWGLTTIQIHTLLENPAQRQAILGGLMVQAGKSLVELCEVVEPRDLCVENLESPPFEDVWPLVEPCGVSVCLDVGHLAWQGGGELEFLTAYAERIQEIHLHDAMSVAQGKRVQVRDHLALGHGGIKYRAFLSELERADFEGAVILELNSKADLDESVGQIRAFL